jgi:hypothetical protein
MKTDTHFWSYIAQFLELEILQSKVAHKTKTQFYVQFFFEYRVVYEIMWKKFVEPDRPQITNMAHAHCIMDT